MTKYSFKEIFTDIFAESNMRHDELEELIACCNRSIVIFGAGSVGEAVAECLQEKNIIITAFCDNHKSGWSERFNVPITNVATLMSDYKDAILVICVGPLYSSTIKKQVIEAGFPEEMIFQRYNAWHYYSADKFRENYYDGYEWAYNFFSDKWSREIITNRIRGYLGHCELPYVSYNEQYFEEGYMPLSDQEVFYDIGGFDGDTSETFSRCTNGKYRHIYFFEPDESNLLNAQKKLKDLTNITWINKAVWARETEVSFVSEGGSSRCLLGGDNVIPAISIDSFRKEDEETHLSPTFMKMDIEGAEQQALIGAVETISQYQPKLAVCVYHKPEDIYELPQTILKYGNYKMSLSHYTPGMNETVLYALPK